MDWQFYQPSPWQGELKEKGGGRKLKWKEEKEEQPNQKQLEGKGKAEEW